MLETEDVGRRVVTYDGKRGWFIGHTVVPAAIIVTDSGEEVTVRVDKATIDTGGACLPKDECLDRRQDRRDLPRRLDEFREWLHSTPARWADGIPLHPYQVADALNDILHPPRGERLADWERELLYGDEPAPTTPSASAESNPLCPKCADLATQEDA